MPVRVIRGRSEDPGADRRVASRLLERAADCGEPALRAWTPPRQVAFGRRDANEPGYEAARTAASRRGFPPFERSVGGRAVAYDGETTVAFAYAVPLSDPRTGLSDRYEWALETLGNALTAVGAEVRPGEPPASFCPGDHSLREAVGGEPCGGTDESAGGDGETAGVGDGGKLAGIAQRVGATSALVSGVVVVDGADELRDVLSAVYDRLGVKFDPASVGSVATAGGTPDPDLVAAEIEAAFLDGRVSVVESLGG